jgi:hypothetical protein
MNLLMNRDKAYTMPRPVRSTRNKNVNYAESVCSADEGYDSDYVLPTADDFRVAARSATGVRRSQRVNVKDSRSSNSSGESTHRYNTRSSGF